MASWVNIAGLVLDIVGAGIMASPVMVDAKKVTRLGGIDTMELAQGLIWASKLTRRGLTLLILGFVFQIAATWMARV